MSRIPKIIHYCWFGGGELLELEKECLASWHEHMPEWEIPEDGWYNATHLTKEASEEFTRKLINDR